MKKLQQLDASRDCGINDEGIKECISLIELNASDNSKITNVNHLQKLEKFSPCENYSAMKYID